MKRKRRYREYKICPFKVWKKFNFDILFLSVKKYKVSVNFLTFSFDISLQF